MQVLGIRVSFSDFYICAKVLLPDGTETIKENIWQHNKLLLYWHLMQFSIQGVPIEFSWS